MGLQLKGDNEGGNNHRDLRLQGMEGNSVGPSTKEENPWDIPGKQNSVASDYEEPKVIYNAAMADLQGQQKQENPITGAIVKTVIALVICGALFLIGKQIVSVVKPEGQDITALLKNRGDAIAGELGVTFMDNPSWAANVYEYSESDPIIKGAEGVGVVYMDGRQVGVHIANKEYTMFGVQVGDGEQHMYNNTTYPYDSFVSILNTMSSKATVYIYYNEKQNDCIFFLINNTTNRIESMTYFYDYKEMTEELE